MSSVLNTLKGFLSPSPRAKVQKSRPRGQQDIVTMFSHQRALAASRQTLTPPSLTTASSSEDRSSEPKDRSMTPGKQSTPTSTLNDSLQTNDDVKTKLFQPNQDGNDAERSNVSGATLMETTYQTGQELLTTSMDGLDPLWVMGQVPDRNPFVDAPEQAQDTTHTQKAMEIADRAGQDQVDQVIRSMNGIDPLWGIDLTSGRNPFRDSTEQAQDTEQTSKAMTVFSGAAQKVQKSITKKSHPQVQKERRKTAASSRPQRSTPQRPDLHSNTQATPTFDTPSIEEPASKRLRTSVIGKQKEAAPQILAPASTPIKKPTKQWLSHGLFLGQDFSEDKPKSKNSSATTEPVKKVNSILPRPMFAKGKLLEDPHAFLDFKLPFDVFSPLPPGQPKPDDWKKLTRSKLFFSHIPCHVD